MSTVVTIDAHRRPDPGGEAVPATTRTTVMVKTFERRRVAKRCLRSIRRVFDGPVIVADDSATTLRCSAAQTQILALPFNSGVAKGRNAALALVDSEFVFVCDDDIVFSARTDFPALESYLDRNRRVDLVAVRLLDLPVPRLRERNSSPLFTGAREPLAPFGTTIDGALVVGKVAQVYLARTESLRRVGWDENLRMVDHLDFFSRASGMLVCVQHPEVTAYHVQDQFDAHYAAFREDVEADLSYLARKWSGVDGANR